MMIPEWLSPRVGKSRLMYVAHPTRMMDRGDEFCSFAKNKGYAPINPFSLGEPEEMENGLVGRQATLELDLSIQRGCGITGIFGMSAGVHGELKDRLSWDKGKNVRVFPYFDPKWDEWCEKLGAEELFRELRGLNKLIVFVGPSAIGKTYWTNRLIKRFGGIMERVKNVTTRPARDLQDYGYYHHIPKTDFVDAINSGAFLETDFYLGEYYGSSLEEIKRTLKDNHGILAITPSGAKALYRCRFEINLSFVLLRPADDEVLLCNLDRRGELNREKRAEKLEKAKKFVLPDEIPHQTLTLTGTEKDEDKVFDCFDDLVLKN